MRRLEQLNATPLAGTSGARQPFFSPDGLWIAFFADGKLKKIPVGGGTVVTLCDVPQGGRGGSWSPDGTIIFAPSPRGGSPLRRVSEAGGASAAVTASVEGELVQRFPQVLPGGRAVLYSVTVRPADDETAQVVVQPLRLCYGWTEPVEPRPCARPRPSGAGSAGSGGELYAVSYRVDGQSLTFERPRLVGNIQSGTRATQRNFDVHPDGQRFAVAPVEPPPSATAQRRVVVVFNFLEEVRRLVPMK